MVDTLERSGSVRSPAVRRVFAEVVRETFVAEVAAREGLAAVYRPHVPIVTATTSRGAPISASSAPSIMAPMLENLELGEGMRVLEVGAGSGYNAALLRSLVGRSGTVVSIDLDADLVARARRAWDESGHLCRGVVGDGRMGWAPGAPYDRIIVTASSPDIPPAWFDQLREGGLLELPLCMTDAHLPQRALTLRREGDLLRSVSSVPAQFMSLRGADAPEAAATAALRASVVGADASITVFASLSGVALARRSNRARQRLIALLLQDGRRLRSIEAGRVHGLIDFLHLSGLHGLLGCSVGDRHGVAMLAPGGAGIAACLGRDERPGAIVAWGAEEAPARLLEQARRWSRLGSPGADDLRVTVAFSARVPGRHWRTVRRGDSRIAFDWVSGTRQAELKPG
jgi:protein-L-isoaspartate(D-aspartate) O-methyltransferase